MRSRRVAVTAALTVAMSAALLSPMAHAAPAARSTTVAACSWSPELLTVPARYTGGGQITAADSQGGYAGTGAITYSWGTTTREVLRWKGGQATEFARPKGLAQPTVTGVNRDGTVVGDVNAEDSERHAFRTRDGKLERLPEPAGTTASWATGINDAGDIVGHVAVLVREGIEGYYVHTAVLWPANAPGTVVKLSGGLPGTGQTKATGIDQDGTVLVEHMKTRTDAFDPAALYLWREGSARKLGLPSGTAVVHGNGISNGRVAGVTQSSPDADGQGILWDRDGTPLRPERSASVNSVNSSGQSVGWTTGGGGDAVWQLDRRTATLPGALGLSVSADDGALAGWSRPGGGDGNNQPTVWRCR
ncbi:MULTISPECIES: hypothetical protein [Streptomyces]|uniref:hypothetical protein n=1 Tax=Streptomyces TaxID=1883 RepID=UPI0004CD17F5|nr:MULTISPECIES: hypothetical protein [Streptomyces]KOT65442.1 hypothetical protein ADK43_03265 [Streptomyces rimosus subsp. rimosus]